MSKKRTQPDDATVAESIFDSDGEEDFFNTIDDDEVDEIEADNDSEQGTKPEKNNAFEEYRFSSSDEYEDSGEEDELTAAELGTYDEYETVSEEESLDSDYDGGTEVATEESSINGKVTKSNQEKENVRLLNDLKINLSKATTPLGQKTPCLDKTSTPCLDKTSTPFDKTPTPFDKTSAPFDKTSAPFDKTPKSFDKTPKSFDKTPKSFDKTPKSFDETPKSFDETPKSFDKTPKSFDETPKSFDETQTSFDETQTSLDETQTSLDKAPTSLDKTQTSLDKTPTPLDKTAVVNTTILPRKLKKLKKKATMPLQETETNEAEYDEYAEDSSDEEDLRNTIGNIPINWYDECNHLGYNLDGEPIMKPKQLDTLDKLIRRLGDVKHLRTVVDKQTGQEVQLSNEDLDIVQRILTHRVPDSSYDMYQSFPDLYSHEVMDTALSGRPEHKRSFLPSRAERLKVRKIATLIKKGLYKHKLRKTIDKKKKKKMYDLWKPIDDEFSSRKPPRRGYVAAPKVVLPGPHKSYNPPPEYGLRNKKLLGDKTGEIMEKYQEKLRNKCIRKIPADKNFFSDFIQRLHDLNFGARKKYMKVQAKSSHLLPKLPDKMDLRPFPTVKEMEYKGHRGVIQTISIHPNGRLLASGSHDHTVKVWEVDTGRCLRSYTFKTAIKCVVWNPNPKVLLLAVVCTTEVILVNPESYMVDSAIIKKTNSLFRSPVEQGDYLPTRRISAAVTWRQPTLEEWSNGQRLVLELFQEASIVIWHRLGDYFITVLPGGVYRSVIIHQISKWRSQVPFVKRKQPLRTAMFHPSKPWLFVVALKTISVYDLRYQRLLKKIKNPTNMLSSIDIHPSGEHFIVGTFNKEVTWYEYECTRRPHTLSYHMHAVRQVRFHPKYPMFASCADDGSIIVTHATVYDNLEKDPLIIPLKKLTGHCIVDDLGILDIVWHPHEPFLFSAGADGKIFLWH